MTVTINIGTTIPAEVEMLTGEGGEEESTSDKINVVMFGRHAFLSQEDTESSGQKIESIIQLKRKQAEQLRDLLTDWLKQ